MEIDLGLALKMPVKDAFVFSVVTGAGYLDNPVYPFTPKGLMKLFYNAFDYKFVTGIFENTSLKNTPYMLSKAKPFLFDSEYKYIVPIEFYSERELQQTLETHFSNLQNPTDFIILRIEKSKKGNNTSNGQSRKFMFYAGHITSMIKTPAIRIKTNEQKDKLNKKQDAENDGNKPKYLM